MFPFDVPSWDAASGAIFQGVGTSLPGVFSALSIILCIAALAIGQLAEAGKYAKYK